MAEIPARYLVHTVDVETFEGATSYGDVFGAKQDGIRCMRDDKRRLVRNPDGDEVLSETTLYLRLAHLPAFPVGSRVHLPTRIATVITCADRTDGGLGAWQHLEVTLT